MVDEWILRSLRRIIRAVDIHSKRLATLYELTTPQLVCLRELEKIPWMSAGRLAREVSLSPATLTGILNRLDARGLIERHRSPEDRRKVRIAITLAGRELVGKAPLSLHERFSRRLTRLPEEEQAEIERALNLVVQLMEAEDIDAAPLLGSGLATADPRQVTEFLQPDGRPELDTTPAEPSAPALVSDGRRRSGKGRRLKVAGTRDAAAPAEDKAG